MSVVNFAIYFNFYTYILTYKSQKLTFSMSTQNRPHLTVNRGMPQLEEIVQKIIELKCTPNLHIINKFNIEWLIHELDE